MFRYLLLAWLFIVPPTYAAELPEVDVALVVALDASSSVVEHRWQLQLNGTAQAIAKPAFFNAIRSGDRQAIAVALVIWALEARTVVQWRTLRTAADCQALSAEIAAIQRPALGVTTAPGAAISHSAALLLPWANAATRRVIDLSGDGPQNDGPPVDAARTAAIASGVTINGLPILTDTEKTLDDYYTKHIIGGDGAFVVVADSFEEFAEAMYRKLIREIAALP